MDEHLEKLIKELGEAINESISSSPDVNRRIQRIKDQGYDLYVLLDATIGLNRENGENTSTAQRHKRETIQFRIDVNDLSFLRSVGIDPTRKVAKGKRARKSAAIPEE
ncbi:MAG: hypothetical protein ACYC7A_01725 [Thermoanaerobaculia bacterium]